MGHAYDSEAAVIQGARARIDDSRHRAARPEDPPTGLDIPAQKALERDIEPRGEIAIVRNSRRWNVEQTSKIY